MYFYLLLYINIYVNFWIFQMYSVVQNIRDGERNSSS